MTNEEQEAIDDMTYEQLLRRLRFTPLGNKLFSGVSGAYVLMRMQTLRKQDPKGAIAASKRIGWRK